MKKDFQIICIDDEYKSDNGMGYIIGLIDVSWTKEKLDYFSFGKEIDGEDYREDCWRADIGVGNSGVVDMLSYVSNDGRIHEYGKIDGELKEEILNVLNIKDRRLCKETIKSKTK